MKEEKFPKKYQTIFESFKDHHKTEGYDLEIIQEIYVPVWFCKQEIYFTKEAGLDEFSKILLRLVDTGIKQHSEICRFLGLNEDDFCLSQLDYLLGEELLEEKVKEKEHCYELTYLGREYLKDKNKKIESIEGQEMDYHISDLAFINNEEHRSFYNDLTQEFFDKNQKLDDQSSKRRFAGYNLQQLTKEQKKAVKKRHIPHGPKTHSKKNKSIQFHQVLQ